MKRAVLWLLVAGLMIGGVVLRSMTDMSSQPDPSPDRRCTSPAGCVSTYFQALKVGSEEDYLNCLSFVLRAEMRRRYSTPGALAEDLRVQGKDLRAWVTFGLEQTGGGNFVVWVDQQFSDTRKRQKIHLQSAGASWVISKLEPAQDLPQEVPFGTHVSKVQDRKD